LSSVGSPPFWRQRVSRRRASFADLAGNDAFMIVSFRVVRELEQLALGLDGRQVLETFQEQIQKTIIAVADEKRRLPGDSLARQKGQSQSSKAERQRRDQERGLPDMQTQDPLRESPRRQAGRAVLLEEVDHDMGHRPDQEEEVGQVEFLEPIPR